MDGPTVDADAHQRWRGQWGRQESPTTRTN